MSDRAVTPWQREAKHQERLKRAHDERRTVLPRFTPWQAQRMHAYLVRIEFEEAAGRELGAALHELKHAIEVADAHLDHRRAIGSSGSELGTLESGDGS